MAKSKTTSSSQSNTNQTSTSNTSSKSTTTQKQKSTSTSNSKSNTTSKSTTSAAGTVDATTQANYEKYKQGYQQSQSVADAYAQLQQTLNNKPGAFSSGYESQLNDIYNKISNREKFSYDFNKDAMYQLYKDRYMSQGRNAMQETMGQASALTGGYSSSYAQSVGQQAYQNYLDQLNEVIPTLRNQAKEEYNEEGNELLNRFNMANTLYGNDWQQYRANVSDWQSDRTYGQGAYESERNFDYNKYASDRDYTASQYWNQKNAVQSTEGTSNTTTKGKETTSGKSTSTTNSNSNTVQNTNTSTSTVNSSSTDSGSGSSSGSKSNSSANVNNSTKRTKASYTNSSFYNQLRNIARVTQSGEDTKERQADYLYTEYEKGNITYGDALYLAQQFGISKDVFK